MRFNQRYGHTFVVPRVTVPAVAARVMNLQDPTSKIGKSDDAGPGIVYLLDEPDVVRKKIMRAVTDKRLLAGIRRGDRVEVTMTRERAVSIERGR